MRSLRVPGLLLASMVLAAACGGSSSPGASGAPSGGGSAGAGCQAAPAGTTAAATVAIRDFTYSPAKVTIKAGEAVAWTNEDSASHTATTADGACDTKSISKGATVTLVFPKAGTYEYHCAIHATMPKATVEVTE